MRLSLFMAVLCIYPANQAAKTSAFNAQGRFIMQSTFNQTSKPLISRIYHPFAYVRQVFGFIPMQALALGLFLAVFVPVVLHGQSTDGVITGTVTDTSGAALPDVAITARNTDAGTTRSTKSGPDGEYRINAVRAGTYDLLAEGSGFAKEQVRGITITVGLEVQRNFTLKVGSIEQTVSVTDVQPLVDTSSNDAGSALISTQQIEELPISGRQATQLSLLLPGTSMDTTRAARPSANVGNGSSSMWNTTYLVDGLPNMINGAGDPRDNIQEASIKEFKVSLAQTPAEYGFRPGGVVSLVTKSGTNNIHGEAFEFFRNHAINRVDYYSQKLHDSAPSIYPIAPFNRNQFGGAIGGPILKDRLHYFGSFEEVNDQEYFTVAPGGTGATTAQQAIQKDYAGLAGSFRTGSLVRSYFGRADWQINPSHTAFLRVFLQYPNLFYASGATGSNAAYSIADGGFQGWTYAAGETWVVSPRIINQFSAQVAQSNQTSGPPQYETPSQSILDASRIPAVDIPTGTKLRAGGSTVYKFPSITWGYYTTSNSHTFYQEAIDTLTVTRSEHTFKFGADISNMPRNQLIGASPLGTWTFANDVYFNPNDPSFDWNSLVNAKPIKFTASTPTIPIQNEDRQFGFFAQDEWKIRRNLTLNLGVRYDLQTGVFGNRLYAGLYPSPGLPSFVHFGGHHVYDNFAPRFGFAWDPRGDGKTVIRGGYGIIYSMNSVNTYMGEVTTLRQTNILVAKSTGITSFPDPYNGLSYSQYASKAPPNITVNSDRVSNPPNNTGSIGVTRQLSSDIALVIDAIDSKQTKQQITENVNSPYESSPGVLTNTTSPVRPLPVYGQINQITADGNYVYKGLLVHLEKQFSHHNQYSVSYTLAKQRDNYNSTSVSGGGSRTDYYYPDEDKGWSLADRRNTLVLSGSTKLPLGITLGGIYTFRSSLPLSATTGADNNGDGATTDYVLTTHKGLHNLTNLLSGVNTWRATKSLSEIPASQIQHSRYNQLDSRISKDILLGSRFKIQAVAQLFNVLGTDNFGGIGNLQNSNASGASSTFGEITSAYPHQQGELALRFLF
jgi:outer membrane receptor protein involved in Fe transport